MEKDLGKETALALRQFEAVATLDRKSATNILKIMWPNAEKASPAEFAKALGLCVDYGLDPRLNELFLIPFKKRDKSGKVVGITYETVRGIRATRKVALRKHKYSYVDFTPRLMTEEEEKKVYKAVDPDRIRYITKLKDMETDAEAPGYGEWPRYKTVNNKRYFNNPKGLDKGNSMENMAAIHSERAALERLYPADMPSSRIPVVDEAFIEGEVISEETREEELTDLYQPEGDEKIGELAETEAAGKQSAQTKFSSQKGEVGKQKISGMPAAEGEGFSIDLNWLKESQKNLKWTEETMLSFIASQYKVSGKTITEGLNKLTRQQAEDFVSQINKKLEKQASLF